MATLITGGFDRGYDYAQMAAAIVEAKIDHLILFPVTGEKIEQELIKISGAELPGIDHCDTMEEAVKIAYRLTTARPDLSVVLCLAQF